MATLALSAAGQIVGGLIGGPIGATLGRALGALAGSSVDSLIFGGRPQAAPEGSDIRLTGSAEGGAIPRLYGWSRLSGNIIWATQLEEMTRQSAGAKGMGESADETTILASFAVAFCEGEVAHLGRVWADGELMETAGLAMRFYRGTADQMPDSLIEAKQGTGDAPAYRGLCYIVFERLPLTRFGNRIPIISVELCRLVGTLEPAIRAVTLIPGATEFGYDPTPRVRLLAPGSTAPENTHESQQVSDWTLSLDALQDLCPGLTHVSLVVSWFGDDLRASHCSIRPKVEAVARGVEGAQWLVSGLGRAGAETVSSYDGGPAYGGTPSDATVLAAIADLKARGLKVTLYPLPMMDIPAGNALANPYGGTGQPAYPWRGRITSDPAPGEAGTADGTAAVSTQVAAFLGDAEPDQFTPTLGTVAFSGSGWGYRRMVLHYAHLAKMAGGVDALLIGSELVGLTTLRDEAGSFPFVAALRALAADVRAVLGAGTSLTYAADWSEFSGYQPAGEPGAKYFHLDPLWASEAIDAIGIDNYMPIADWRDGTTHADAASADSPYETGYLQANIAGGEGYDWYYASDAERIAGLRTPITDGSGGEPWTFRFKDIVSWWCNAHHDRPGGIRNAAATPWVPQSKPIWFTELGCAAIDKGANQPNVFGDPKSAESGRPYFSSGAPDPLMQRQALRAHLGWWDPAAPGFEAARNPISTVYGRPMLDPGRIYLWTWDARPYPAFPARADVWADAANYATGHWLTGRLGALASDELIAAMAADYGLPVPTAAPARPLVSGLAVGRVGSLREALDAMLAATGLAIRDRAGRLDFGLDSRRRTAGIGADRYVAAPDTPLVSRKRPDPTEAMARLALGFIDRERDYLNGMVTATRLVPGGVAAADSGLVLDPGEARFAAESQLARAAAQPETLSLRLPPSLMALEAGDLLALDGQAQGPFRIASISDAGDRQITAEAVPGDITAAIVTDRPARAAPVATRAIPLVWAAELPPATDAPRTARLLVAACAAPWPGRVTVTDALSGATLGSLTRSATLGVLAEPLATGPRDLWDDASALSVTLYDGHLSSLDDLAVLAGGNRLAVETDSGGWEILGFVRAELLAPGRYRLSRLLRGQAGTSDAIGAAAAGNRVVALDGAGIVRPVPSEALDVRQDLVAYAGPADPTGTALAITPAVAPLLPLSPVHLAVRRQGEAIALSWVRRSRADTDGWAGVEAPLDVVPERYRVTILDGATVRRQLDVEVPGWSYALADQTADFGGPATAFTCTVAQIDPVYGPGAAATGAFHG